MKSRKRLAVIQRASDMKKKKIKSKIDTEQEQCPYSHEPNAITLKAIEDIENEKHLHTATTVEELFKKLGI